MHVNAGTVVYSGVDWEKLSFDHKWTDRHTDRDGSASLQLKISHFILCTLTLFSVLGDCLDTLNQFINIDIISVMLFIASS